jgi:environmental stress-induced protein Ves
MRILRAAGREAVPWKNGGGVTREVMAWPDGAGFDEFRWRVSIAEVREAGPFSRFEGVERTLAILDGRMRLDFADRTAELDAKSVPAVFAGEESCHGTPLDGPVTDLNLMTRGAAGRMQRLSRGIVRDGLVVALAVTRIGGETLHRFDAAVIDGPVAVGGDAYAIVIT